MRFWWLIVCQLLALSLCYVNCKKSKTHSWDAVADATAGDRTTAHAAVSKNIQHATDYENIFETPHLNKHSSKTSSLHDENDPRSSYHHLSTDTPKSSHHEDGKEHQCHAENERGCNDNWCTMMDDCNSLEMDYFDDLWTFPPPEYETLLPPCCGQKARLCDPNEEFRRLDGSCNNLENPEWGLPNSTYCRLLPPKYSDGLRAPRMATDKKALPGPRTLRVALFPNGESKSKLWSISILHWGQLLAHDMSQLKQPDQEPLCCTTDGQVPQTTSSRFCFPIKISPNDPTMGAAGIRCVKFTRTITDRDLGCNSGKGPSKQISVVTPYMDLSNVYGNEQTLCDSLKLTKGGLLKTEIRKGRIFPPTEANRTVFCSFCQNGEKVCYRTGDSRSNQNTPLALLQIMFLREHNRIAKVLKHLNPHWDDERLYQEARRINIAEYQHISYCEWLSLLLGEDNLIASKVLYPKAKGFVDDYDPTVSPDVINEHAHAAFRHFHSQITGTLNLMDDSRSIRSVINISDWLNRPEIIEKGSNIEMLTIGMLTQPAEDIDALFPPQITDQVFAGENKYGIDLIATDIQRDRDHALAYYNDYRKYFGLKEAKCFEDYEDLIPKNKVALLKKLYKSYKDVDLYVGGSLESPAEGAHVGPTFLHILMEQFKRTRKADRFWYENKSCGFTPAQLAEIRKSSVSRFFCDNGDGIKRAQLEGFDLISKTNPLQYCDKLPKVDLTKWKEHS